MTVAPGDRICLVGRNGSGKSTLLKSRLAWCSPTAASASRIRRDVQYLPQEADFAGFDTVRGYVEAGLGPTDDPYQAQALVDELGLTGDEDPQSLSGGEARRAALARVLVLNLTSCCSMSRPTTSTCPPSNGSKPN